MEIKFGSGKTKYGPGVEINLTPDEVAHAICTYMFALGVITNGPRTVTIGGELCQPGRVYVDPSGFVMTPDGKRMEGCGRLID